MEYTIFKRNISEIFCINIYLLSNKNKIVNYIKIVNNNHCFDKHVDRNKGAKANNAKV